MAQTKVADLIKTEVFADAISAKMGDKIKLYPLAAVQTFENDQVGVIKVPTYQYVGDASVLAEGAALDPKKLQQSAVTLNIVKVAEAFNITDEAAKSGYGNPVEEAENQLTKSISGGIEKKMFEALEGAILVKEDVEAFNGDTVLDALALFGEDQEGDKFLLVNPADMTSIKKDEAYIAAEGTIYDCKLVVANKVPVGKMYIMKQGAVGLYISKDVEVNTAYQVLDYTTVIAASSHFATHLKDVSKVIKVTKETI